MFPNILDIPDMPEVLEMLDSVDMGGMVDIDDIGIDIDIDIAELIVIMCMSILVSLLEPAISCLFPIPDIIIDVVAEVELPPDKGARPRPGPALSTYFGRH